MTGTREQRFHALFTTHAAAVTRYVNRRIHRDLVDDLVADVFVIAWEKLDTIPHGYELPWLYRTSWNILAATYRRTHPTSELTDEASIEPDFVDDLIEHDTLRRAWDQLSARDREILRLTAWEGLDGKALATALNISPGGAGAALHRARTHLAEAFAAATKDEPLNRHIPHEGGTR